jgi:predicted DNA-binding ribbon-helix-helix protein
MKSSNSKRSVVIAKHKTSVSPEDAFWDGLQDIGRGDNKTVSELVADIDTRRVDGNLSSSIRLFVLNHFQDALRTSAGHA